LATVARSRVPWSVWDENRHLPQISLWLTFPSRNCVCLDPVSDEETPFGAHLCQTHRLSDAWPCVSSLTLSHAHVACSHPDADASSCGNRRGLSGPRCRPLPWRLRGRLPVLLVLLAEPVRVCLNITLKHTADPGFFSRGMRLLAYLGFCGCYNGWCLSLQDTSRSDSLVGGKISTHADVFLGGGWFLAIARGEFVGAGAERVGGAAGR